MAFFFWYTDYSLEVIRLEKVNVLFCSFPDFSSNAKALFEFMRKKYGNKMNLAWACYDEFIYNKLLNDGISVYKIGSSSYFDFVKTVDIFFTTHANVTGDKPDKAIYVELWHGVSSKHIGFLSDNMSHSDYEWYSELKRKINYFIVPSDFWRVIFSARFNVKYNRTLALGYPKLDFFVSSGAKKKLKKVLGESVNNKKIIYYMPTFRSGCNREDNSHVNSFNVLNLKKYDEKCLLDYLEKNNYLLCIKKHPSEEHDVVRLDSPFIKVIDEDMLRDSNITINEILDAADLLITDYSSLGLEFVFLDKPVIYLTTDLAEYKLNRGITFGDFDFWTCGFKVDDINGLLKSVDDCFSKDYKYKERMKEKKKLWFGDLKDGGCKAICDYFFDNDKISKSILNTNVFDREESLEKEVIALNEQIDDQNEVMKKQEIEISVQREKLDSVYSSKGWKILMKVRGVINFIFRR